MRPGAVHLLDDGMQRVNPPTHLRERPALMAPSLY